VRSIPLLVTAEQPTKARGYVLSQIHGPDGAVRRSRPISGGQATVLPSVISDHLWIRPRITHFR
jgi:hypothetical protein